MEAPTIRFMEPQEAKSLLLDPSMSKRIKVLDVRDEDFAGGNIKNCVNIPLYDFYQQGVDHFIEEHCGEDIHIVIVHCYLSQQRGPMAARRLSERLLQLDREGRPEVYVLKRGWRRFVQLYGTDSDLCENVA